MHCTLAGLALGLSPIAGAGRELAGTPAWRDYRVVSGVILAIMLAMVIYLI